jgi:hypothetical protein
VRPQGKVLAGPWPGSAEAAAEAAEAAAKAAEAAAAEARHRAAVAAAAREALRRLGILPPGPDGAA